MKKVDKNSKIEVTEYNDRVVYKILTTYKSPVSDVYVESYVGRYKHTIAGSEWVDYEIVVKKKSTWLDILLGNRFSDRQRKAITKAHNIMEKLENEKPLKKYYI